MLYLTCLTADSSRTCAYPACILARFQLSTDIYRHCHECIANTKHAAIPVEPSWRVAEGGWLPALLCSLDSVGGFAAVIINYSLQVDNVEVEIQTNIN